MLQEEANRGESGGHGVGTCPNTPSSHMSILLGVEPAAELGLKRTSGQALPEYGWETEAQNGAHPSAHRGLPGTPAILPL